MRFLEEDLPWGGPTTLPWVGPTTLPWGGPTIYLSGAYHPTMRGPYNPTTLLWVGPTNYLSGAYHPTLRGPYHPTLRGPYHLSWESPTTLPWEGPTTYLERALSPLKRLKNVISVNSPIESVANQICAFKIFVQYELILFLKNFIFYRRELKTFQTGNTTLSSTLLIRLKEL